MPPGPAVFATGFPIVLPPDGLSLLFLPQPAQPAITPQRVLTQVQQQWPWLALKHRGAECLYVVVVQIHVSQ